MQNRLILALLGTIILISIVATAGAFDFWGRKDKKGIPPSSVSPPEAQGEIVLGLSEIPMAGVFRKMTIPAGEFSIPGPEPDQYRCLYNAFYGMEINTRADRDNTQCYFAVPITLPFGSKVLKTETLAYFADDTCWIKLQTNALGRNFSYELIPPRTERQRKSEGKVCEECCDLTDRAECSRLGENWVLFEGEGFEVKPYVGYDVIVSMYRSRGSTSRCVIRSVTIHYWEDHGHLIERNK